MMNTSFNLGFNLTTAQKLTPQMQQAIKLLQLSSLELEQEVQMKLDSNPLLERVEEDDINAEDFNSVEELTRLELSAHEEQDTYDPYNDSDDNYDKQNFDKDEYSTAEYDDDAKFDSTAVDNELQHTSDDESVATTTEIAPDTTSSLANEMTIKSDEQNPENTLGELSIDTEWDEIYIHNPTRLASADHEGLNDYEGATTNSLQDHIRWQLNFSHLSEIELLIAEHLIDALDDNGFIQINIEELKDSLNEMASFYQWQTQVSLQDIEQVIQLIQCCEPLGVGARNLAECLQIQLRGLDTTTAFREKSLRLLDEHALLVSNNIDELIKKTGIKKNEISDCLQLIRTLNSAPGQAFSNAQPVYNSEPEVYDIPDVIVQLRSDQYSEQAVWKVELNPDTLPKLRVNQEYANLIKRGDDSADNVYLRDNLMDARLFIRSIQERNQNLLKVATCIVTLQQEFLLQGATAMKPLILKEVADAVELHESTVSRLTTNKSILTPQGLFSLKYFFSSHVSSVQGNVSSTAISAMIEELINNEDCKKPLSDSAIKQQLQSKGIDIARRTVAKYREAMNIGSSTQRKQKY